jgi:hypothetical protein
MKSRNVASAIVAPMAGLDEQTFTFNDV